MPGSSFAGLRTRRPSGLSWEGAPERPTEQHGRVAVPLLDFGASTRRVRVPAPSRPRAAVPRRFPVAPAAASPLPVRGPPVVVSAAALLSPTWSWWAHGNSNIEPRGTGHRVSDFAASTYRPTGGV